MAGTLRELAEGAGDGGGGGGAGIGMAETMEIEGAVLVLAPAPVAVGTGARGGAVEVAKTMAVGCGRGGRHKRDEAMERRDHIFRECQQILDIIFRFKIVNSISFEPCRHVAFSVGFAMSSIEPIC